MARKYGPHRSIIQDDLKYCYLTGRTDNLQKHHIYFGPKLRKISDKYGFWVWLTGHYHNQSNEGVHGKDGHELDMRLKRVCQRKFEETHSRDEFISIIGKNYL